MQGYARSRPRSAVRGPVRGRPTEILRAEAVTCRLPVTPCRLGDVKTRGLGEFGKPLDGIPRARLLARADAGTAPTRTQMLAQARPRWSRSSSPGTATPGGAVHPAMVDPRSEGWASSFLATTSTAQPGHRPEVPGGRDAVPGARGRVDVVAENFKRDTWTGMGLGYEPIEARCNAGSCTSPISGSATRPRRPTCDWPAYAPSSRAIVRDLEYKSGLTSPRDDSRRRARGDISSALCRQ